MTTSASCGCDESKAWRARALSAELSLRFARAHLLRLLDKVDGVLGGLPGENVVTLDGGVVGQTVPEEQPRQQRESDRPMSPAVWQRVGSWMADRLAKESR